MNDVKKNFIYNSIYQLLILLIPLVTTPYVSRILGAEGVGLYSYAHSIAYYFVIFAMLGLNNYGNRTIAMVRDDKNKLSQTFWSIYALQVITSLTAIIVYIIYIILFNNTIMPWILLFYVISTAFDINWFFFGMEKFKLTVTRNTIVKIISTVCIFIFVRDANDVYLYGIIMALGLGISQFLLWPFVRQYISFYKPNWNDIIKHLKPNLVLFVPVIAVSLYKYMDKIMLGALTTVAQVGFHESSEKIINIPMALINSLGTVMLPRMSNMNVSGSDKESKKYIRYSILFAMFLSTSMGFGIMAVSKEFVPLFYGDGFETCITLFQILLPSCMFLAFANVIRTQYLIPKKKDTIYIISVSLGAIVNIIVNSLLIPTYQSAGAAIGTLCAEATVCIYQAFSVRKELPILNYIYQILPFVFSGLIMFLVLNNLSFSFELIIIELILKIFIGIFIYMFVLGIFFIAFKFFIDNK